MSNDTSGADDGSESTDGYVHRPSGEPAAPADGDREFDWRGWTLVATVVFAFLIVPAALLFLQEVQSAVEAIGLTYRDAYLVLPLVPAFLLGIVAVWSAIRARSDG